MASQLEQIACSTVTRDCERAIDRYFIGTIVLYSGPGAPKMINPMLDGGLRIDFNKSTDNTTILRERLGYGELENFYINHDRGPGRIVEVTKINKK